MQNKFSKHIGFWLLNFWLAFHCVAIFLPPASIEPSPSIVQRAFSLFRFYPQTLFMDHGYHFFSPDPGDSTLLRFVARDRQRTVRGRFPNREIRPRLLYHRYFMLTESIPRYADFETDSGLSDLQAKTYAACIARREQAEAVELFRLTHRVMDAAAYKAGRRLDDPETFQESKIGDFTWPAESSLSYIR